MRLLHDPASSFTTVHADSTLLVIDQRCGDGAAYRWLFRRPPGASEICLDDLLAETLLRVHPAQCATMATRHGGAQPSFDRSQLLPQYHVAMVAALGLCSSQLSRMLFLGVGGGALCMHLRERHPACTLDCIEPDRLVLGLAKRYFGLRPGPRLRLHTSGAEEYLRRRGSRAHRFEAIFLDASVPAPDDGMCAPPPSLRCAAALRLLRDTLGEGGVLAVNALGAEKGVAALRAALGAVFEAVHTIGCDEGNQVLVCCASGVDRLPPGRRRVWLEACAALDLSVT